MNRITLASVAALSILASVTSASAGSFWSFTANSEGKSASACEVETDKWFATSCIVKSNSSVSGSGGETIGFVSIPTGRSTSESASASFGSSDDTNAETGCQTIGLNAGVSSCGIEATAASAPDVPTRTVRKRGFSLVNW